MTDRQLKYLLVLAEEGNMTAAAKKLYISQPSLSNLLSGLEKQLGVVLFDRSASPIVPTYAGEKYLSAARKILGIQREFMHQVDEVKFQNAGKLILGCGTRTVSRLLPVILPAFMENYPQIKVEIVEGDRRTLTYQLETGEIDLMLTNHEINADRLNRVKLFEEKMVLYAPKGTAASSNILPNQPVDLSLFANRNFVFINTSAVRQMIDTVLADYRIDPEIIFECSSWEVCLAIVGRGLAFTILPEHRLPNENNWKYSMTDIPWDWIECFHLTHTLNRSAWLYYRKSNYHPHIIECFLNTCRGVFPES